MIDLWYFRGKWGYLILPFLFLAWYGVIGDIRFPEDRALWKQGLDVLGALTFTWCTYKRFWLRRWER